MKTILLSLLLTSFALSSKANTPTPPVDEVRTAGPARHPPQCKMECTFSASITLSLIGQQAAITCTSSQSTCDAAINDVARCVKLAKARLKAVLQL